MDHPLPVFHMFAHQEPSFHHNLLCGLSAVGGLLTPEYVMLGVPVVAAWALVEVPTRPPATTRDRTASWLSRRRVFFILISISVGRGKSLHPDRAASDPGSTRAPSSGPTGTAMAI